MAAVCRAVGAWLAAVGNASDVPTDPGRIQGGEPNIKLRFTRFGGLLAMLEE